MGFEMFRGGAEATVDDKGRVKIPAKFRSPLLQHFGPKVYVTSFWVPSVKIYPISEWERIENIVRNSGHSNDPRVRKFLMMATIYGDEQEIDSQGRILIPQRLRKYAKMFGDVIVCGYPTNEIELWNEELFKLTFGDAPMTDADQTYVSELIKEGLNGLNPHPSNGKGGM